jgi:hypothetical protein
MKYEDILPAIITALDTSTVTGVLSGQTITVETVNADLPSVFPAVGLHFVEKNSIPRPAYNMFKLRDGRGELSVYIQVQTSGRDTRLIKSAIDQILFGVGIEGLINWKVLGEFDRETGDEKLQGVKFYKLVVYQFEYTVTD